VPANKSILKVGSKGDAVKELQRELNQAKYLKEDGDFGPATEFAVKAFQQSEKLEVDGVVGPKTWAKLEGR